MKLNKIDLKNYRIKSTLTPVGEQSGILAVLLGMMGLVYLSIYYAGWNRIYLAYMILICYFALLLINILNWITERDKYLELKE